MRVNLPMLIAERVHWLKRQYPQHERYTCGGYGKQQHRQHMEQGFKARFEQVGERSLHPTGDQPDQADNQTNAPQR